MLVEINTDGLSDIFDGSEFTSLATGPGNRHDLPEPWAIG
jgi:hypothetical protein